MNVLCFGVYLAVLYRYYANRVPYEEEFLVELFGDESVNIGGEWGLRFCLYLDV